MPSLHSPASPRQHCGPEFTGIYAEAERALLISCLPAALPCMPQPSIGSRSSHLEIVLLCCAAAHTLPSTSGVQAIKSKTWSQSPAMLWLWSVSSLLSQTPSPCPPAHCPEHPHLSTHPFTQGVSQLHTQTLLSPAPSYVPGFFQSLSVSTFTNTSFWTQGLRGGAESVHALWSALTAQGLDFSLVKAISEQAFLSWGGSSRHTHRLRWLP
jgi:hypothetical protein